MLIIPSKPPMGWNSWDVYLGCPDQETLIKTADTMAETFLPYGYQYFVIDAFWYENQNTGEWSYDRFGRLLPDPDKFPFWNAIFFGISSFERSKVWSSYDAWYESLCLESRIPDF